LAPVLLAGLLISAFGVSTTVTKLDWAGAAHFLDVAAEPEDTIIVATEGKHQFEFAHYYQEPLQEIMNVDGSSELSTLLSGVDAVGHIWIATIHPDYKRIGEPVIAYAESNFRLVECQTFGEKVNFVELCQYEKWPYERVFELPTPEVSTSITWDQKLGLLGYDLPFINQEANELAITVYWQALTEINNSYTGYFHLVEAESGSVVAQADVVPRGWSYPTSWWARGEVVEDTVQIPLHDVTPGRYELQVGWYEADSGLRLPLSSDGVQLASNGSALLTYIDR
jgi:hypothetical protein